MFLIISEIYLFLFRTHVNYYHLMMDYEDPDVENWEEYKPCGQPLLLMFDDIVITRKSR